MEIHATIVARHYRWYRFVVNWDITGLHVSEQLNVVSTLPVQ